MLSLFWRVKNIILSLTAKKTIGARALLIRDNKVLLVKHSYIAGWYSPGGGVDPGESGLQALKRELAEETGVTLTAPPAILGFYHSRKEGRDDYIILYLCHEFTITPVYSAEISASEWFPLDNLPEDISLATKRRIDEYLGNIPLSDIW